MKFGDLPGLMAGALHSDGFAQACAEVNLESELRGLVESGDLMVRDPLTHGRHTFPFGDALRRSVLLPKEDLRPLFESRGIGLRLTRYGTGPNLWTIENAASAIAEQEGWHQGARDTLRQQLMQAAHDGPLTVRHPHTALAYRPDTVRDFYELVTPADVNVWLRLDPGSSLRWNVSESLTVAGTAAPTVKAEEVPDPQRRLAALRALGGNATRMNGNWSFTRINELTANEKANGRKRSDQKTIRRDLEMAAKAEREEGPKPPPPSMFPT